MVAERRDELAKAGLEHLQAAAKEMIQATRSLLDAAEELVEDPSAVQDLVATLGAAAQAAASRFGFAPGAEGRGETGDDSQVQHIDVS